MAAIRKRDGYDWKFEAEERTREVDKLKASLAKALSGQELPIGVWTPEMKSAAMSDAQKVCDQAKRIAELETALREIAESGGASSAGLVRIARAALYR